MSGFSISNNLLANEVNLELSEHQQSLGTSVRDLSSGLRVNSAADDPSGNAIAASLQTHSQAFNQASQNVTNAQNAAAVADGGLAAVTDILLRMRELAVGAASTVESTSDRTNIQAEINQLLLEINRIAQNTNFNGRRAARWKRGRRAAGAASPSPHNKQFDPVLEPADRKHAQCVAAFERHRRRSRAVSANRHNPGKRSNRRNADRAGK